MMTIMIVMVVVVQLNEWSKLTAELFTADPNLASRIREVSSSSSSSSSGGGGGGGESRIGGIVSATVLVSDDNQLLLIMVVVGAGFGCCYCTGSHCA